METDRDVDKQVIKGLLGEPELPEIEMVLIGLYLLFGLKPSHPQGDRRATLVNMETCITVLDLENARMVDQVDLDQAEQKAVSHVVDDEGHDLGAVRIDQLHLAL